MKPFLAALCASAIAATASAQPAPYHHYRTLDTPHFRVTVPDGLEREGRVAGAAAEHAYAQLARELATPRGIIDLVVTDDADYSNGYATTVPTNRIVVFATPPVDAGSLRLNEDWLGIVITHELTHIFHLDRVRGVWSLAQHIFGRGPALFPNSYGPSWLTEGLAVYYESRLTDGGRLKDSESRMIARAAALEHRLPALNALSLGSPVFPGGSGAYGYGSLFVDYLARTRGDSSIRRFIDAQSATVVPWALERGARNGFGIGFGEAYDAFRDSIQRSVSTLTPPLPGWRELTTHGYFALDPRFTSDSTLVYAAADGRSTSAEYALALDGTRHRIGRRNALGPSVPYLGGLLFAQPDLVSPSEVRSDLYVERDGVQRRLTHGLRLIQPDARRDGTIVAVQLAPTRSSLLVLDPAVRTYRTLRNAAPDETWSEPRWSPDGSAIAVSHRTHGGTFSLEVIDVASGVVTVLDRGAFIITSPSWLPDGKSVAYSSEESGVPSLVIVDMDGHSLGRCRPERSEGPAFPACPETGVYTAEVSPGGRTIAAVTLRADGYHIGVAPFGPSVPTSQRAGAQVVGTAPIDTQPLAAGDYHNYAAWRSVLPRYWYPVLDNAPTGGTLIGANTSGHDVVYRHIYDASAAVPTIGRYPTASLNYRYAGLRTPFVDLSLSQDYLLERTLSNGGTTQAVGSLLRQVRFGALSTTFTRPRYRSYASFSVGASVEGRSFLSEPGEFLKQVNDTSYTRRYTFPGAFISTQWSNTQRPSLSISREDGVSVAVTGRFRGESSAFSSSLSSSVVGAVSGYKSLDLPGFAHHVVALRVAGGVSDRRSASSFTIGGTSGTTIQIVPGYAVGEGRRTFGVRGFPAATSYGTSALGGTLEYRAPLSLGGRGLGMLPLFFDRASLSAFADAAVATCVDAPRYSYACARSPRIGRTIASTGAELVLSAAILDWDTTQNLRFGVAVPTVGKDLVSVRPVSVYLAYGLSF
ncbi:hypothetical protein BH11GEM1_BH11GEM1_29970 [soil metagenome]